MSTLESEHSSSPIIIIRVDSLAALITADTQPPDTAVRSWEETLAKIEGLRPFEALVLIPCSVAEPAVPSSQVAGLPAAALPGHSSPPPPSYASLDRGKVTVSRVCVMASCPRMMSPCNGSQAPDTGAASWGYIPPAQISP